MLDLEALRQTARAFLGSASYDLRMASARLAPTDVLAGLRLALLATRVNSASARGLLGLRAGPASPEAPDPWLLAAARLHDAVSDAADTLINLLLEAEETRRIVTPAPAAQVNVIDGALFGFLPDEPAFEGWTDPQSCWDLGRLTLRIGSPAWRRRRRIVEAVNAWGREHQAAVEAAGVLPMRECCSALYRVQVSIRDAVRDVRPGTVAGARAAARVAARSLVEMGDDATDLVGIVQSHAAGLPSQEPAALAWSAVVGLLVTAPTS